jgi:hypothetical protein
MWYTQVDYEELVKQTLARIGGDLGAEFEKPSAAEVASYPRGKWLYETEGPSVGEVEVYRSGASERRGSVLGCQWDEERGDYERRLERELRGIVLKLIRTDEHDDECPRCQYELRRELNGMEVRLTDDSATCSQCGAESFREFQHRIKGRSYCEFCLRTPEPLLSTPN